MNWKDQLTKYNGKLITYDNLGNPITIGENITLNWINGRQLNSYIDQTNTINYKYSVDGIRISKIVNNVQTNYYLEGKNIIFEQTGENMIYYNRSNVEGLIGFKYNNEVYYYMKNNQDDIIGILDSDYNLVAKYRYDSWGNIISITDENDNDISNNNEHIGNINPYRYRSYYYDKETKLYYLNSRYYNPRWGRFINADGVINSNKDIISNNLYLYCSNNPINNIDLSGSAYFAISFLIKKVVKTIEKIKTTIKQKMDKKSNSNKKSDLNNNAKLPDYTKQLNKVLQKNTNIAKKYENISYIETGLFFYDVEKSGGIWDYKLKDNWERDINVPYLGTTGKFLYNGQITTAEDFGNIHYGYVGSSVGFPSTILFIGGGYAKCGITKEIFEDPYYCDDINDHIGIQKGIDRYYSN